MQERKKDADKSLLQAILASLFPVWSETIFASNDSFRDFSGLSVYYY